MEDSMKLAVVLVVVLAHIYSYEIVILVDLQQHVLVYKASLLMKVVGKEATSSVPTRRALLPTSCELLAAWLYGT